MSFSWIQFGLLCLMSTDVNAALFSSGNNEFRFRTLQKYAKKNHFVTPEDIENSTDFAYRLTALLERLEENIRWKVEIERGSPSYGLFILYRPDKKAIQRGREALIASKAIVQLINTLCVGLHADYQNCMAHIKSMTFKETHIRSFCSHSETMCTPKEYDYPYRSSDGSCNHITNDGLGEAYSAYSRFLPAEYSDGVSLPRRAHDRKPLPNARIISNSLFRKSGILNDHATMVVLQWAEFVEHDLSRFASSIMIHSNNSIDCCDKDGFNLSPRYLHPFCSSIPISSDDDYYSKHNVQCMSYVKSLPAISSDCSLGPNEQINQATHFLDGSQIYGTTPERTSSLRAFVDGKLKFSKILEKPYLPLSPNPTKDCQVETSLATCFTSGDSRVNFLPHVTVMYTLWMREHNRIATELAKLNVDWDDEKLFQETRRIVIAEMQHITYNEWIYEVLDYNHIQKIEKTIYDGRIDPRISNSFASAAMRSFWSMMSEKISLVSETRQNISHISVEEHFNRPDIFLTPGAFDSLVRGFATQSSENIDIHYAEDLTNKFSANGKYGYDVVSLDIQRSRDHGLPDYNTFRSRCGLRKVNTFAEFADHMTPQNIHILSGIYSDPNDVDLIIGGLMEQSEADSLMGPTFSCLIEDQLIRTKKGDRYFYSNKEQPKPFSDSQMEEIQKVTLARIFCDNSDEIQWMQPNVFKKIGKSNNPVRCDGEVIPRVSLMPWLDQTEKYLS